MISGRRTGTSVKPAEKPSVRDLRKAKYTRVLEEGERMNEYKSFYKTVGGGEGSRCNYPTRLDMYGKGCQHNCQYCYARSLLDFRGLWNPSEPACADKEKVVKRLDRIEPGSFLRLGGMTDPFQPIESEYHLTEWLINELNDRKINYLIVTKSATVADCEAISPKFGHVQVSVTSTGDLAPEGFEVASSPEDRLKAAQRLFEREIDTQIRLSPFIPSYVKLDRILDSPVDKVLVEFLRVNTFIKRNFPSMDFRAWTVKSGGYNHLPLEMKLKMLEPLIAMKRLTVCEDHPEHYEYFRQHINANPKDCCDLKVMM